MSPKRILLFNGLHQDTCNDWNMDTYQIIKNIYRKKFKFVYSNTLYILAPSIQHDIIQKCSLCVISENSTKSFDTQTSQFIRTIQNNIPIANSSNVNTIVNFINHHCNLNLCTKKVLKPNNYVFKQPHDCERLIDFFNKPFVLNSNAKHQIDLNIKSWFQFVKPFKNILLVSRDVPNHGGASTNTSHLANFLKRAGFNVFCVYINIGSNQSCTVQDNHVMLSDTSKPSLPSVLVTNNVPIVENTYPDNNISVVENTYPDNNMCTVNSVQELKHICEILSKHHFTPDAIITKTHLYDNPVTDLNCPIIYLVPGIFTDDLDANYHTLDNHTMCKYLNYNVIQQIINSDIVFTNSSHTLGTLISYFRTCTNICVPKIHVFYSSFINHWKSKSVLDDDKDFNKRKYDYGIIVSNSNRKIKNVQRLIQFLITQMSNPLFPVRAIFIGLNGKKVFTEFLHNQNIRLCTCTNICTNTRSCTDENTGASTSICTDTVLCTNAKLYSCTHICTGTRLCTCKHVCIGAQLCTNKNKGTSTHICTGTGLCTCTRLCTNKNASTGTNTCLNARLCTSTHVCTNTCTGGQLYANKNTDIDTSICTCTNERSCTSTHLNAHIDFIEHLDNESLLGFYSNIKYVLADSFYESCSNVMVESMYYGCKYICLSHLGLETNTYLGLVPVFENTNQQYLTIYYHVNFDVEKNTNCVNKVFEFFHVFGSANSIVLIFLIDSTNSSFVSNIKLLENYCVTNDLFSQAKNIINHQFVLINDGCLGHELFGKQNVLMSNDVSLFENVLEKNNGLTCVYISTEHNSFSWNYAFLEKSNMYPKSTVLYDINIFTKNSTIHLDHLIVLQ